VKAVDAPNLPSSRTEVDGRDALLGQRT